MIAVLTGDISNSRGIETKVWLKMLKDVLIKYGDNPGDWEIYRGDSFQLKVEAEKALIAALHIKASVKETKEIDVRISIGIGEESYSAEKISESNGTAYINSGEAFEAMKKESLVISSEHKEKDKLWNMIFDLAMVSADQWSESQANAVKVSIENQDKTDGKIAKLIGKSQGTFSVALKRSSYNEIMRMNHLFQESIK